MSTQTQEAKARTTDNVWWAVPALIGLLADTIAFLVPVDAGEAVAWYVLVAGGVAIVPAAVRSLVKGAARQLARIPGLLIALFIAGSYLFAFHRGGMPFGN
ncbi:hypothetical protein [Streptomyces sp. L2]|uniref:hypothetical protein n=1 Tax=Streptomyces sp. L2 TaxID=2162665 RepID=UPI001011B0DF|nr:hypothetical protein [Streptomyces sp. L2]